MNSLVLWELLLSSPNTKPGMLLSRFLAAGGLLSGEGDLEKDLLRSFPLPLLTVALLLSAPDTGDLQGAWRAA